MPLIIDGGRVPPGWGERRNSRQTSWTRTATHRGWMASAPGAHQQYAGPGTRSAELQFFELLDIASGDVPVYLKLYSLTGIPRADRGERGLNSFYWGMDDLWNSRFDGVIMTGTEPRRPDLREETCWPVLDSGSRLGRTKHHVNCTVVPGSSRRRAAQRWHRSSPAQ